MHLFRLRFFLKSCFFLFVLSLSQAFGEVYDVKYQNFSKKNNQKTGVLVVAYNRPEYFKELLSSLEKNKESKTLPFFFFLDGGPNAAQDQNEKLIKASSITNKVIVKRETNYGIVKNHVDSKRFMFDWCNFDSVIVLEEDLVVSKTYINTLMNFYSWAKKTYSNVGTVQLWSMCFFTKNKKKNYLKKIRQTKPVYSLVTYCMGRDVWDSIKVHLYDFEKQFLNPLLGNEEFALLRSKPKGKYATDWVKKTFANNNNFPQAAALSKNPKYLKPSLTLDKFSIFTSPNQDQLTSALIYKAGYVRLQSIVNRVVHIGIEGFVKKGRASHQRMQLDEFSEDSSIKSFGF